MPWYIDLIILYIILDRICVIWLIGDTVTFTKSVAMLSLVTGSLIIWGLVSATT